MFQSLPNFFGLVPLYDLASTPAVDAASDVSTLPSIVFTSHRGSHRATVAMVMAVIVLGHTRGFPTVAKLVAASAGYYCARVIIV